MTWQVWTDGSCRTGAAGKSRAAGGWAAVVERGHDGFVLRGRVPDTTNVRMELTATIEGLRATPAGDPVTVFFDCTVILSVDDERRGLRAYRAWAPDRDLWDALQVELAARQVDLRFLEPGHRPAQHLRAHAIAGAEGKALAGGLDPGETFPSKVDKRYATRGLRVGLERPQLVWTLDGRPARGSGHRRNCSPVFGCVYGCVHHPA